MTPGLPALGRQGHTDRIYSKIEAAFPIAASIVSGDPSSQLIGVNSSRRHVTSLASAGYRPARHAPLIFLKVVSNTADSAMKMMTVIMMVRLLVDDGCADRHRRIPLLRQFSSGQRSRIVKTGSADHRRFAVSPCAQIIRVKVPLGVGAGLRSTISGFCFRLQWHRDRPKSKPAHSADCTGSLGAHLALGGDSGLCAFEPPASATMILKASACLRTSTSGRRSGDRTNTSAHSTADLRCIASPAQALPKRTTQLLRR